ncbi:hypothetical protein CRM78_18950 [Yersinia pseudotuberculosis]|nr:hypothetical protein CRM78_18950 [Yersinia pseudotuberculosis]
MCVGRLRSPQSLTCVSSRGFTQLPPSCNSNYFGYIPDADRTEPGDTAGGVTAPVGGVRLWSPAITFRSGP